MTHQPLPETSTPRRRVRAFTGTLAAATLALATAFAPQTALGDDEAAAPANDAALPAAPAQSAPRRTERRSGGRGSPSRSTESPSAARAVRGRAPLASAAQTEAAAPATEVGALATEAGAPRPFQYKEKFGYLNADGTVAIRPRFEAALPFSEGLAAVKRGEKWFYINAKGESVIPALDEEGQRIFTGEYWRTGSTRVTPGGEIETASPANPFAGRISPYTEATPFREGYAWVGQYGRYGIIDKTGKKITPYKYDSAEVFSDGLAVVKRNGKCGYVNTAGEEIIPPKYDFAQPFQDGMARVGIEKNNSERRSERLYFGLVDKTGKEVIPLIYKEIRKMTKDTFRVSAKNIDGVGRLTGLFHRNGKQLTQIKYSEIMNFQDGLAAVNLEYRRPRRGYTSVWGFIDETGKEVIPPQYTYAQAGLPYVFYGFVNGIAIVRKEISTPSETTSDDDTPDFGSSRRHLGVGIIDKTGKEVVPFGKYAEIKPFAEGLAAVRNSKELWGFIDVAGIEIIPCQYSGITDSFENGIVTVRQKNGEIFQINKEGKPTLRAE